MREIRSHRRPARGRRLILGAFALAVITGGVLIHPAASAPGLTSAAVPVEVPVKIVGPGPQTPAPALPQFVTNPRPAAEPTTKPPVWLQPPPPAPTNVAPSAAAPSPTPSAVPAPSPTPTPSPSQTPPPTPDPTPTPTPTPEPEAPTPTPTPAPQPAPSPKPRAHTHARAITQPGTHMVCTVIADRPEGHRGAHAGGRFEPYDWPNLTAVSP